MLHFAIDNDVLHEALNIEYLPAVCFDFLGSIESEVPNTLSFVKDEKYLQAAEQNPDVSGVFTTPELAAKIKRDDCHIFSFSSPEHTFYKLFNFCAEKLYVKKNNIISASADIHPSASIAEYNVKIGDGVVIAPNVTILPDVEIGDNSIVLANTVVGAEGFDIKRDIDGNFISVRHIGRVLIGKNVRVDPCVCICKGLSEKMQTVIGDNAVIGALSYISHAVKISTGATVYPGAVIGGSCEIGADASIGMNATVSNKISMGKNSFASIGSVVAGNVMKGEKVTGNLAMPHKSFMYIMKKMLKKESEE